MKKLIRSIIAFFSSDKKEEVIDPNARMDPQLWNSLPHGEIYYTVCSNAIVQSYERNLMDVSRVYPSLKKSTLYRAFKGDPDNNLFNAPRTYVKNNFKVIECRKF